MRESKIEKFLCDKIKELGGIPYKFTSPGRRSVADRLCVLPQGHILFVECKAPGEELTDAQQREKDRLEELSQWHYTVSTKGEVLKLFNFWQRRLQNE